MAAAGAAAVITSATVFTAASPPEPFAIRSAAGDVAGRALADVAEHAARPEELPPPAQRLHPPPLPRPKRTERGWLIDSPESPRPHTAQFLLHGQRIHLFHDDRPFCKAWRLREWVQLRCGVGVTSAAQLAGSRANVRMWLKQLEGTEFADEDEAVFVFPVRPGDRRLFQATNQWSRWHSGSGFQIQQSWRAGHEPRISVRVAD